MFIRENTKAASFNSNRIFVIHVNYEKTKNLFKIKSEFFIEKSGVSVYRINIYTVFNSILKTLHGLNYLLLRFKFSHHLNRLLSILM